MFNVRRTATLLGSAALFSASAFGHDPLSGDYSKNDVLDVRVVSYNHNRNFIDDSSADAEFDRILTAIQPDILCMQEFPSDIDANDIANRLNSILPNPGGWHVHEGLLGGIYTAIASRYPLSMTRIDTIPSSSTRGVTIALADLPDSDYDVDLYLMGVHLKCCGNAGGSEDDSRQDSSDAMANWLADARGLSRSSGNNIVLPPDTPIVVLGDFNYVGGPQPEQTLRTGNIIDNGTYGSDAAGDWDSSSLLEVQPLDPFTGDNFTWQGNNNFPPGRLDRIYLTDSVVDIAASFVFNTDTMSSAARSAAGVNAGDTLPWNSSDHLPIAVDLRLSTPCPDADADGVCDADDICPNGDDASDGDGDGIPDACDCPGDTDGDGTIDLTDLANLLAAFGRTGSGMPEDFDNSGSVDLSDLAALLSRFGGGCP